MTESKHAFCRLCLENITNEDFKIIDSVTRDILDVLLFKLKFQVESQEVICNSCVRTLKTALEFKSTCLNTDNMIIPYVDDEKMLQVDLNEIYIKENGIRPVTGISYSDNICRLCMQPVKDEARGIGEEELEAIQKFVPEMNIMIVKDPVICKPCFDSLSAHNNFLKDCLEVDQRIAYISESSAKNSETYVSLSEVIKTEDLERDDFEMNKTGMAIKTECVDIKTEEDEGRWERTDYTGDTHWNNKIFENSHCKGPENQGLKIVRKHKNRSTGKCGVRTRKKDSLTLRQFKDSPLYKCDKCVYETKSKSRFMRHCVKHENVSEVYKCETCEFKTKYKKSLKYHGLRHKDPSKIQMYRCNDCQYKTRYKKILVHHILQHKDLPQLQIYKCEVCHYQSRVISNFNKHQLIHKDSLEVQMYSCNHCDYKSKHKNAVLAHALRHADCSQLQMYKCGTCNFKSRHKKSVTTHQLTHKNSWEVQMYSCNDCDYKSKYKSALAIHVLRHKDPSQVQMYKCNYCDYRAKHKNYLKSHVRKHGKPLKA